MQPRDPRISRSGWGRCAVTDPLTGLPLTRRQLRELEAAGQATPAQSQPAGTAQPQPQHQVAQPAGIAQPAASPLDAFQQFLSPAVGSSAATSAEATAIAVEETAASAAAIAPIEPAPAPTHSESVELPPFVASPFPTRSGKPTRAGKLAKKPGASGPRNRSSVARGRSPRAARISSRLFSMVAMLFAGALLVGVSVPANAIITTTAVTDVAAPTAFVPGQSLAVSSDVVEAAASPKRELPTVTSYAELLRERYGNRSYTYTATTGAVRWPFPYAVPITDGYGERVAPCRGCSTFHQGVDFTPGDGTPITAIAAGVVIFTEVTNSGIGNQVQIEHSVGGKRITSVYAGMQMDSSPMRVGDVVKVGDFVGLVGSTGVATGPHLHFELLVGDTKVDPFAWLKANATNAN